MPYLRPTNVLVAVVVVYEKIITVTSQKCNFIKFAGFCFYNTEILILSPARICHVFRRLTRPPPLLFTTLENIDLKS